MLELSFFKTRMTGLDSSIDLDGRLSLRAEEGPIAEGFEAINGGLDGKRLAAPARAAKERPSSASLRLRFREALEDVDEILRIGDEGCSGTIVRAGDASTSLLIGLGASRAGVSSKLEVRPSLTTLGLDTASSLEVASVVASSEVSDDTSEKSLNTGSFGLEVAPMTRKLGLDVGACLAAR